MGDRSSYTHRVPAQDEIVVGHPAGAATAMQAGRLQCAKVFLVTSRSLSDGPLLTSIAAALGDRYAGSYAGVRAHSPRDCVLEGAAAARAAQADLLVAIGGGSVIDAAKVMQLCLSHDLRDEAGLARFRAGDTEGEPGDPIRTIAVPTTLSAAEFNCMAGVTDPVTSRKEGYNHPLLIPSVVILDPAALAQTPPDTLLATGVRALDHCVETFCSAAARPVSDALALHALKLLWSRLPAVRAGTATADGYGELQVAAWMSITGHAAGVPLGASHAIGRVLGSVAGVAHGHTSAILLPAVLAWNAEADPARDRQAALLGGLGLGGCASLAEASADFIAALGQPRRLRDVGVTRAQLPTISRFSVDMLAHPSVNGNARSMTQTDEVEAVLDLAW